MSPKFRRILWWLALVAVADCCLLTMAAPGTGDVLVWLRWMQNVREHGLVAGYAESLSDYTPLSFVFLRVVAGAADALGLGYFIVLKAGITLFAAAGALVIWLWRRDAALTACLLGALALSASALGYLDVIYLSPLLLSLWALEQRRLSTAAFWFTIATSVKWQPLLIAPFFLLFALQRTAAEPAGSRPPWLRVVLGALPVAVIMVACFGFPPLVQSFRKALSHPALSSHGLNLPWLAQWFLGAGLPAGVPVDALVPPPGVVIAFKIAFFGVYFFFLHTLWRHGRTFADFLWASCAAACTYFTLNTGVHENHLFMAMVMAFALLGTGERIGRPMAVHCALMANLNLLVFYGFDGRAPLLGGGTGVVAGAACVLNGAFLAVCLLQAVKLRRSSSLPAPSAAAAE